MPRSGVSLPDFERGVADLFADEKWQVRRNSADSEFLVRKGSIRYAVAVKVSSEGRADRLVPLLAQTILESRSRAQTLRPPASSLAVVASRHVPLATVAHLREFAKNHAPDAAIGIVDTEGLRVFVGEGLEDLNATPRQISSQSVTPLRQADLFSDLNQWMLKILLGQRLPESLISVPRAEIKNASHLARMARVSLMSASRFLHLLRGEGFLDEGKDGLRVVCVDDVLERWAAANRVTRDIGARWILRKTVAQFLADLSLLATERLPADGEVKPRLCMGLFAAADALGMGFVRGTAPHIYLEHPDPQTLVRLGVSLSDTGRVPDVLIRIPTARESVFRAATVRNGLPVSDILQVWLDTAAHPARGREQADEIRRRILDPILRNAR